jgi:hypothetical protein
MAGWTDTIHKAIVTGLIALAIGVFVLLWRFATEPPFLALLVVLAVFQTIILLARYGVI